MRGALRGTVCVAWVVGVQLGSAGATSVTSNPCRMGTEEGTEFGYTQCAEHSECGDDGYCDASRRCFSLAECACYGDPLGGACPVDAPPCADGCTANADCNRWDWSYCRRVGSTGVCWAAGECTLDNLYKRDDADGCREDAEPMPGGAGHGALKGPRKSVKEYRCMGVEQEGPLGSFQPGTDGDDGTGNYTAPVPAPDATLQPESRSGTLLTFLEVMLIILFMLLMPMLVGVGVWLVYLRDSRRRRRGGAAVGEENEFSELFWEGHITLAPGGRRADGTMRIGGAGQVNSADLERAMLERGIELIPQRNLFELSPEGLGAEMARHGPHASRSLLFMLPGGRVVVLHRNGGGPQSFFSPNVPPATPHLAPAEALKALGCAPASLDNAHGACCPICLDEFAVDAAEGGEEHETLVTGCCGTVFHKPCLFGWLEQASTCPNCRKDASTCGAREDEDEDEDEDANGDGLP